MDYISNRKQQASGPVCSNAFCFCLSLERQKDQVPSSETILFGPWRQDNQAQLKYLKLFKIVLEPRSGNQPSEVGRVGRLGTVQDTLVPCGWAGGPIQNSSFFLKLTSFEGH